MQNGSDSYDLAIIGGGPAGIAGAATAANLGARVAVIDSPRSWGVPG